MPRCFYVNILFINIFNWFWYWTYKSLTDTHRHTHTLALSHTHTHTHALSLSLTTHTHLTLSLSHTHTHTHTLSLHTHAHTHTQLTFLSNYTECMASRSVCATDRWPSWRWRRCSPAASVQRPRDQKLVRCIKTSRNHKTINSIFYLFIFFSIPFVEQMLFNMTNEIKLINTIIQLINSFLKKIV